MRYGPGLRYALGMGRPTIRTVELEDQIVERISQGETLKAVCADPNMPAAGTVMRWEVQDKQFGELVAHARRVAAHMLIGEAREIVDDGRNDWMEKLGRDGQPTGWKVNGEAVRRSELRAKQRWQEAAALAPREFAPKHQVEHSGGINVADKDDEALVEQLMALLSSGHLPAGVEIVTDDEAYKQGLDLA